MGAGTLYLGQPLGSVLGWVFCLLLCFVCERFRPSPADFFLIGFFTYFVGNYWVLPIIVSYAELSFIISGVLFLLYVSLSALQFVVAGFLLRLFQRAFGHPAFSLASAWTVAELLYARFFPWCLGHLQLPVSSLSQVADLAGAEIISWLVLYWSAVLVSFSWRERLRRSGISLGLSLLLAAFVFGYGEYRIRDISRAINHEPPIKIGFVQPNLQPALDFRPEKRSQVVNRYREMSFELVLADQPELLIWPESSFWHSYPKNASRITPGSAQDPFPGYGGMLLFGGQSVAQTLGNDSEALHNTAFLLHENIIEGRYYKERLFPFSEQMPFSDLVPALSRLNKKGLLVAPGPPGQPLIEAKLDSNRVARLGAAICYEDIFPELMRRRVRAGANLLLSLSNDAWFLKTPAALQHHYLAAWHALELRRFMVRATVDGVTGVIDPLGRTVASIEPFTAGTLIDQNARLLTIDSPYTTTGSTPLLFGAVLLLGLALMRSLREGG